MLLLYIFSSNKGSGAGKGMMMMEAVPVLCRWTQALRMRWNQTGTGKLQLPGRPKGDISKRKRTSSSNNNHNIPALLK